MNRSPQNYTSSSPRNSLLLSSQNTPRSWSGQSSRFAAKLNELRERTGISYITVSEPDLATFAPVIELLRNLLKILL